MATIPARAVETLVGLFGDHWGGSSNPTTDQIRQNAAGLREIGAAGAPDSSWARGCDAEGRALDALADYYEREVGR